jgi:cytoskeleton protein RodZ
VTEAEQLPSVGKRLAAARKAAGLTVEQVAEKLKLLPRQVAAIENDDHAALPGPVFVRGFIRNYARVVNLDADALVAEGAPRLSTDSALAAPSEDITMPMGRGSKAVLVVAAGAVIALAVIVLVYLWLRGDADTVGQLPVTPAPQAAAGPKPVAGQARAGKAGLTETRGPEPFAAGETTATADGARFEMVFHFDSESWIDVSDADGEIARELVPAGAARRFSGKPPFALVIGNARNVHLTYRGKPVDLAQHTDLSVARLTLE